MITRFTKSRKIKTDIHNIADLPFEQLFEQYNTLKSLAIREELANRNAKLEGKLTSLPADVERAIIAKVSDKVCIAFADDYDLQVEWHWLGPQLMAYLADYKLPNTTNINAFDFLQLNLKTPRDIGIYRFVVGTARGNILKDHTKEEHLPYCSLVPLIMAAQKKFNNIPYSAWDKNTVHHVVDKELYTAMTSEPLAYQPTADELLSIRDIGLSYISTAVKTRGQKKSYNPQTYHQLSHVSDTVIGPLHRYAKAMVTQIWCAHPVNRNQYMILDPWDWDRVPDPLINTSPVSLPPTTLQLASWQ